VAAFLRKLVGNGNTDGYWECVNDDGRDELDRGGEEELALLQAYRDNPHSNVSF